MREVDLRHVGDFGQLTPDAQKVIFRIQVIWYAKNGTTSLLLSHSSKVSTTFKDKVSTAPPPTPIIHQFQRDPRQNSLLPLHEEGEFCCLEDWETKLNFHYMFFPAQIVLQLEGQSAEGEQQRYSIQRDPMWFSGYHVEVQDFSIGSR